MDSISLGSLAILGKAAALRVVEWSWEEGWCKLLCFSSSYFLTRCFINAASPPPNPRHQTCTCFDNNGKIMQSERRCTSALNVTVWIHWGYSQWIKSHALNLSHFWQPSSFLGLHLSIIIK